MKRCLMLAVVCCLSFQDVGASCGRKEPTWKSASQGPKVTQPSGNDPTKIMVSWKDMVKNPECASSFSIWVWRKDIDSMYAQSRIVGPIAKGTYSHTVDNIDPCVEYYFMVEFEVKPGLSRPFKVKGGKTTFKTTGIAKFLSSDPTLIRVEYMYRNRTNDYDMTKGIIKFNKNKVVKYPNCLKSIAMQAEEKSSVSFVRNKRGTVTHSAVATSSKKASISTSRRSSTSSSTHSTTSHNIMGQSFKPPFRGRNDEVALTFNTVPCKQYKIRLTFNSKTGQSLGKTENVRLKSLGEIPNFIPPPITKVLSITPSVVLPKISVHYNSPIPASCLDEYLRAIDYKLGLASRSGSSCNAGQSHRSQSPGSTSPDISRPVEINPILSQHGCLCSNTSQVNLTSTDSRVLSKHKKELGVYLFENHVHEGRPSYIRRAGSNTYYIYWSTKDLTWFLANQIGSNAPLLRMEKKAGTTCPENPSTKKWQRTGTFGSWGSDGSMRLTCDEKAPSLKMSRRFDSQSSGLQGLGCTCSNTSMINLTSSDSRVLSKHKLELGAYLYANAMHEQKPYYVKRNGTKTYYIYWTPKEKTWYLAKDLGSKSPLLKMEKNAGTNCPENPTAKKWQRKNAFGIWGTDSTMRFTCDQYARTTPRYPSSGGSGSRSSSSADLGRLGCVCSSTSMLNMTSRDSRVLSKHKLELGAYQYANAMHEQKPYYVKRNGTKTYYIYWTPKEKTWYLAKDLGSKSPLLKMEKNAGTTCPENPTAKKWQRKNAFGIWGSDSTMKLNCNPSSSSSRPTYSTTARPSYPSSRSTPTARPSASQSALKDQLKTLGCQCHRLTHITVSSRDSRTLKKHKDELGVYEFEGEVLAGKPVYVRKVGTKSFFMYYNAKDKAWWIGKTSGATSPSMKTDDKTDQVCPADPMTNKSKKWNRKNAFGFWGTDDTMVVKCM